MFIIQTVLNVLYSYSISTINTNYINQFIKINILLAWRSPEYDLLGMYQVCRPCTSEISQIFLQCIWKRIKRATTRPLIYLLFYSFTNKGILVVPYEQKFFVNNEFLHGYIFMFSCFHVFMLLIHFDHILSHPPSITLTSRLMLYTRFRYTVYDQVTSCRMCILMCFGDFITPNLDKYWTICRFHQKGELAKDYFVLCTQLPFSSWKFKDAEFMQYLFPVGLGPSLNKWPKWAPHYIKKSINIWCHNGHIIIYI